MNKWMYRTACLGVAGVMLSGCAMMQRKTGMRGRDLWPGIGFSSFSQNQTIEGPQALIDQRFEEIDLALLLESGEFRAGACPFPPLGQTEQEVSYAQRLQHAFCNFYHSTNDKEQARNTIQDRIIAASNQRCADYKQFLKRFDSETNIFLGAAAVATGSAGAIFKAADTARALAGITAALSGIRAEVNEDIFQQRTIQVLTVGFEEKRKEILTEIFKHRRNMGAEKRTDDSIIDYTVESAIGDAIRYHDNCSLVAGLEFAAYAIDRVNDPGLRAMEHTFNRLGKLYKLPEQRAGEPLLPQKAYNEADAAKTDLAAKKTALEGNTNCPALSSSLSGASEAKENERKRLKNVCDELQPRIENLLARATDELKGAQPDATRLNTSLPARHAEVYKATNETDRIDKESSLRVAQDEANRLIEKLADLTSDLRQLSTQASTLLARIVDWTRMH